MRSRLFVRLPAVKVLVAGYLFSSLILGGSSGCSYAVQSATQSLADNLSSAILSSDDPATVAQGLPAYLILLDGLIQDDANNTGLLRAAAKLNSAYASVFADPAQSMKLTEKALDYARRAFCLSNDSACELQQIPFTEFENLVADFAQEDIDDLYILGTAWTGWIETHSADWNAVAEIDRVKLLIERVVELDESYSYGDAYIYLGGLATILPRALGGKPEIGKAHFERAIALSDGANLMAKVAYAERYARLIFDRELHDRLLNEVMTAQPQIDALTLSNTLARQQAKQLLATADEYF